MKRLTALILLLALITACAPASPRYRTGGLQTPVEAREWQQPRMNTNDQLRLGMILQRYLGKPYGSGTEEGEALDCSAFSQQVYHEFNGADLPRTAADQFRVGKQITRRLLDYGDLVFFHTAGRDISHVGVYLTEGDFIHVSSSRGVIISNLAEPYWADAYVGGRRIIE